MPSTPEVGPPVTVVSHYLPHLDEIFAAWLIQRRVGPIASFIFWGTGGGTIDGRAPEEHEAEGNWLIGIGRSSTDEHVEGEPTSICAATLVARRFGMGCEMTARMLAYLDRIDSKGGADSFSLSEIIKAWYQMLKGPSDFHDRVVSFIEDVFLIIEALYNKEDFETYDPADLDRFTAFLKSKTGGALGGARELLECLAVSRKLGDWLDRKQRNVKPDPFGLAVILTALRQSDMCDTEREAIEIELFEALYDRQRRFVIAGEIKVHRRSEVKTLTGRGKRKKIVIVSAFTDDSAFNRWARSKEGINAGVVIQRNPDGHTQIFTSNRQGIDLANVAVKVRRAEMAKRSVQPTGNLAVVTGFAKGCPEWFLHHNFGLLLNGSDTHRDVPCSQLSLDELHDIVERTLAVPSRGNDS